MLIAISTLTECFMAAINPAFEGLFTRMNQLVILQSIRTIKSLSTLLTAITTLATMNQTMLIVNGAGEEALATNRATNKSIINTF
jgi:hypothetical protein